MDIHKAAVVGAGTMGAEIAQVITRVGLPVVLKDIEERRLDAGVDRVRSIYQRRVDRGDLALQEMAARLALVTATLAYDEFGDVDIVIEAVPERVEAKRAVFGELSQACPRRTILATNTSALSISDIAASTDRPHRVIGMHFFNPAHVMKLVEVIPGHDTSRETLHDVLLFAGRLRKLPVVVQECPGFLVNRLLMPYLNEATRALEEGAAMASEIDRAVVDWGMPMGPFRLMDMIGIDICCRMAGHLHTEYGNRMRPAQLFRPLVEAGRVGEKVGAGFYDYPGGESEAVSELISVIRTPSEPPTRFCVERVMYPLINEAAYCVQERIATIPDIDLAMVAGTGMKFRGERIGPLAVADRIGLDAVLGALERLVQALGPRFRPARSLKMRVGAQHLGTASGKGFYEYP